MSKSRYPRAIRSTLTGLAGLTYSSLLLAQEPTPPATAAAATGPARVIVTDTPLEESVLPTVRPFSAAFGLEDNILDVPRNVTVISREQLDAISIQSVRDFSKLTSSSFTTTNFGAPSNPSIRGQTADVFVNGMRRGLTSNGNGLPINFNSVESVDIIKGPPTVVEGVSQYTGGAINLVTKRPFFDAFHASASTTFGSYDQYLWTVDAGGPIIKDVLAWRMSYSGEDSKSYYENGLKKTNGIYAALSWLPSSKYSLDFNFEGFWGSYTESFGVNRPTQAFIDHGTYQTGFTNDPSTIVGQGNPVPLGPTVQLPGYVRLLRPADHSYGVSLSAQAIQTFKATDWLTIVNNSFFYYVDRHTLSSYMYNEALNDNYVIANRTEFRMNLDTTIGGGKSTPIYDKNGKTVVGAGGWSFKNQIDLGVELRYQRVAAYDNYFNEPANAYDLSLSSSLILYPKQNIFGVPLNAQGFPSYYTQSGIVNGDTNESRAFTISPFFQHEMKFGDLFGLQYGARLDILILKAHDPFANVPAAGGSLSWQNTDSTTAAMPNFNISPTFHPTKWLTTYFTYNYSQSTGVANGGGYVMDGVTPGTFSSSYFHRPSQLFEVGAKATLLKDKLFGGVALFDQSFERPTLGGQANHIHVKGLEVEFNYQPTKNFYATASYTLLNSVTKDPGFITQSEPIDMLPRSASGAVITDAGDFLIGYYRTPGLPRNQFNALISYKLDCGLGATLGGLVTGPESPDYRGLLKIPTQFSLDATIFYRQKHWEASISVLNFTNQRNLAPPNPIYAYSSALVELPIQVQGTIKFKY